MTESLFYSDQRLEQMTVAQLEDELRRHNHLYWDLNQPEIADTEYDRLVRRLQDQAPDSPVLQQMGPSADGRLGEGVTHTTPMLSLDKCYNDEDLMSWSAKFEGDVVVTPKMDGIAASIRYDAAGRLALAATRGSGTEGDDITVNVKTIADVPHQVETGGVEVRGEIYMKLSVFAHLSDKYANPRNLAAGAIKHKDASRCRDYNLSFAAYDLLGDDSVRTEKEKFDRLVEMGYPELEYLLKGKEDLPDGYTHYARARAELDFEIDGVVFKTNDLDEQERLGATAHHPRYGMAYKFQGDQAQTALASVEWSVARSGAITPVAIIEPVFLSGATVSRASLHHAGFLEKLDLLGRKTGARVTVTRRGGVIPKVEEVVEHSDEGEVIGFPDVCPSCGGPVRQDSDFLYCENPDQCRHATIGALAHFCKVVDIQGFGEKLLTNAHDEGLLSSLVDLYTLRAEDLLGLERVGQILADKLVADVQAHRTMELATFLRALGIDELGKHVSGILQERYGTIDAVRAVTAEELAGIHTIGEIIAEKVVGGLADRAELVDALLQHVTIEAPRQASPGDEAGPLAGQSFVFTGKMLHLDRKGAQARVKALGGAAPGGVTKALSYLVIGDGAGDRKSSKQKKAEKYAAEGSEIQVISESDFLKMAPE